MSLCTLCKGITLAGLVTHSGYSHYPTFENLQTSAERCGLCRLLVYALRERNTSSGYPKENSLSSRVVLRAACGPFGDIDQVKEISSLCIFGDNLGLAELSLYTTDGNGSTDLGFEALY